MLSGERGNEIVFHKKQAISSLVEGISACKKYPSALSE
jgi:hypothetical protein